MPRTETTRRQYGPNNERCPGDVTDEDRAVVFPPLPGPDTLGRPRQVALRDVRDGIGSIAAAGCAWCPLPKAFPPVSTVRSCSHNRRDSGLPAQINHAAVAPAGERDARDHRPRAGVMDSQGVKTTGNGGISGDDAGKGIKGRKRHIMTDTFGHPVALCVHAANIQDCDAAVGVFQGLRRDAPEPRHVSADCGDRGPNPFGPDACWPLDDPDCEALRHRRGFWGPAPQTGRRTRLRRAGTVPPIGKGSGKTIESAEAQGLIAHSRRMTRCLVRA